MPRPRTVSDEEVLAATARLIGRLGPGRLTLGAVAGEVGLSPATLVQRFGSKRALLLAVAARGAGAPLPPGRGRPLEALVDSLCRRAAPVREPEAMANHLAFLQMDLRDPEFRELAAAGSARARAAIRALLDAAVADGDLQPEDTERLSRAVEAAYDGALLAWAIHREGRAEDRVREQIELLLAPRRRRAGRAHGAATLGA